MATDTHTHTPRHAPFLTTHSIIT